MSLKINSAMAITKCNLTRWHVAEQNISALLPIFTKFQFFHISRWIAYKIAQKVENDPAE
jgi:hypothetical protein